MAGSRTLPIVTTVALGLIASAALYGVSLAWEARMAKLAFEDKARSDIATLNTDLRDAGSVLATVRAYLQVVTEFKPDEFLRFCAALHARTIGLRDVGWAPRVGEADRERFVLHMRASQDPAFDIVQRDEAGHWAPASARPDYYPILYVETGPNTPPPLGIDLAEDGGARAVVDRAIASDAAAASRPLALGAPGTGRNGILAFIPLFDRVSDPAPRGLVFGVFEIQPMMENVITAKPQLAGLTILLFDPESPPGERVVYWRTPGHARPVITEAQARAAPHWDSHVTIADRELGAIVLMPPEGVPTVLHPIVFIPPAIALLLTACAAAYLVASLRRTARLENLTASLRASTESLHQQAEQISHMARHDPLTELPNRRVLFDELQAATRRVEQQRTRLAVLQIDLNRFKPINDIHGHAVGDEVLCVVARRLRSLVRHQDVVARLGGDEFAIILEQPDAAEAANRLGARVIERFNAPIEAHGATVTVGASIGISLAPSHGSDPVALLHAADLAMYCAKQSGRDTVRVFEPEMDRELRDRVAQEQALRQAISQGDIQPYYQPLVLLENEALVGFELLARWEHPSEGTLTPDTFITLAEDAGLIADLTECLLRQACTAAKDWPGHLFIALNVSPSQLVLAGFAEQLLEILNEVGFAPTRLEVEVTEAALVSNVGVARANLLRLQAAGCRVALDDFGTGYSSLSHLRELPFNRLKIDRSFVLSLHNSAESARIVDAIISLGRSMGVATTAEGIESGPVAKHLNALGCEFGQGYHFGRPMSAKMLEQVFDLAPVPVASLA